jgi:methylthioribose-1-phosphate isomerase
MQMPAPIEWGPGGTVRILDQTRLPAEEHVAELRTVAQVADAITALRVRGAPLIGIAAAMGVAIGPARSPADVDDSCRLLRATRPTAVNLGWALDRMLAAARAAEARGDAIPGALRAEADAIWSEDVGMCAAIGQAGVPLLAGAGEVMTICNAGRLATGGVGTALAPIYLAHQRGQRISVAVPETRPLLQGARLTAWELSRAGVPCTLITDGMIATRLARGAVTCAIVGADRIAANGDVANKVGTYGLALLARAHGVPLYVAAPSSTFDRDTPSGAQIPIEERAAAEVRGFGGAAAAPAGMPVWNPAFDVTPAGLVAAYVTDRGVFRKDELPAFFEATRG